MKRLACLKKPVSVLLTASLLNLSVPYAAFRFEPGKPELKPKPMPASRLLSAKEMRSLSGAVGANPYLAGSQKWASQYKGVDLTTGNFSTSATDLSFEGGYGIPVNVTRSYSANNPDEGPLGVGWTLSVDLRTTAGGLLKSGSAPVRAVPTQFRERLSTAEVDPRIGGANDQPVEAMVAVDAGGTTETMQRDVDGVVTPPAWDQNVVETVYETKDGYQIAVEQTVTTPEGTVYEYSDRGDMAVDDVPSNILKVDFVTDRHGNETTYSYGSTVTFAKNGGTATEQKLVSVTMPDDRELTFGWTGSRITSVTDGDRTVLYGYTDGRLVSVTSPGEKTTTYSWGGATGLTGAFLTGITDPRGLATTIEYSAYTVAHYGSLGIEGVAVKYIHWPNGTRTLYLFNECNDVIADPYGQGSLPTSGTGRHRFIDAYSPSANTWVGYNWMPNQQAATHPAVDPDVSLPSAEHPNVLTVVESGIGGAVKQSFYDAATLNLIREEQIGTSAQADVHALGATAAPYRIRTNRTYNFLGQPLSVQTREIDGTEYPRTTEVQYAYWGKDRYFQQKATRDWNDRIAFTDYYPSSAADGRKGQVEATYATGIDSSVHNEFANATGTGWRSTIDLARDAQGNPTNVAAARFDYDGEGRPVSVEKLHHFSGSTPVYVETVTSYDATTGLAQTVVEDYGGIGRTTQTLAWDPAGRATLVQDSANRRFKTTYDDDGRVERVDQVNQNGTVIQPIVEYVYGTEDATIENGMPTYVLDGLSGTIQYISYCDSGGGIGQVSMVEQQDWTAWSTYYWAAYEYHPTGDRATATFETDSGQTRYGYNDYVSVGLATNPSRAFQTLTLMQPQGSNWIASSEEFHYAYDGSGRLLASAFAQDAPTSGTPGTTTYYNANCMPTRRAVSYYTHDGGGRATNVTTVEQTLQSNGQYANQGLALMSDSAAYELTSQNRALKTGGELSFPRLSATDTQAYGYDAYLDVLTGASYNGSPGGSWTYDAAGNRANTGYAYDNLNRMTASPGFSYTNDILGNRTQRSLYPNSNPPTVPATYGWDLAGRMTSFSPGTGSCSYWYRADGMRIQKVVDIATAVPEDDSGFWDENLAVNKPTTRYYHDGQSVFEEDFTRYEGGTALKTDVIRYALGARGIERIAWHPDGGSWGFKYPLYDLHGNMVATLHRGSGGAYALADVKTYDAWGGVRSGSGGPTQRYCASLGHVHDDESSLIYMRARYYEPTTGRFISEDPARDGANWFAYCRLNPTNLVDRNGKAPEWLGTYLLLDLISVIGCAISANGFVNTIAAYEGATLSAYAWAGGYLAFLSFGIYSGLLTGASLLQNVASNSYHAARQGYGEQVLAIADKMKSIPGFASFGHLVELYAWLGIVDQQD